MKKLVRADLKDSDPVQLFWNDGDMYILETDTDDDEVRSFHVAIVCWRLRPASAVDETDNSTEGEYDHCESAHSSHTYSESSDYSY